MATPVPVREVQVSAFGASVWAMTTEGTVFYRQANACANPRQAWDKLDFPVPQPRSIAAGSTWMAAANDTQLGYEPALLERKYKVATNSKQFKQLAIGIDDVAFALDRQGRVWTTASTAHDGTAPWADTGWVVDQLAVYRNVTGMWALRRGTPLRLVDYVFEAVAAPAAIVSIATSRDWTWAVDGTGKIYRLKNP